MQLSRRYIRDIALILMKNDRPNEKSPIGQYPCSIRLLQSIYSDLKADRNGFVSR